MQYLKDLFTTPVVMWNFLQQLVFAGLVLGLILVVCFMICIISDLSRIIKDKISKIKAIKKLKSFGLKTHDELYYIKSYYGNYRIEKIVIESCTISNLNNELYVEYIENEMDERVCITLLGSRLFKTIEEANSMLDELNKQETYRNKIWISYE